MRFKINNYLKICFLIIVLQSIPVHLKAQQSNAQLAKTVQNRLANLISVPIQNNTNFNYGPAKSGTQNIMNIQPVIPIAGGRVITRTIFPLLWQPVFSKNSAGRGFIKTGTNMGLADVNFTAFYAPPSKNVIWGFGPIVTIPTGYTYSTGNWGLGPSFIILKFGKEFTYGFLVNNVWNITNRPDGQKISNFLLQPFLNYNFPGRQGWYLGIVPNITANWNAAISQQWIVPIGVSVGKIVRFEKLPVNFQIGAYYNIVRPYIGPDWQLRLQIQFLFPKSIFKGGTKK